MMNGRAVTILNRTQFQGKNLILGDRGYESYNMLAHFLEKSNLDFLLRVKQGANCLAAIQELQWSRLTKK